MFDRAERYAKQLLEGYSDAFPGARNLAQAYLSVAAALRKYGRHADNCRELNGMATQSICVCGFDTALAADAPPHAENRGTLPSNPAEKVIAQITRDICELEYDPLPDQPDNEVRLTLDELRAILERHLDAPPHAEAGKEYVEVRRVTLGLLPIEDEPGKEGEK